jgi:outer membrane protein assembly factor BamB
LKGRAVIKRVNRIATACSPRQASLTFKALVVAAALLAFQLLGPGVELRSYAQEPSAERLWQAARTGDVTAVATELDAGVDVNAATTYQSTALSFACDRGHEEVVRLLLERGANPNVKDTFYNATPLTWAQSGKHYGVIGLLLEKGAEGANALLLTSVSEGDQPLAAAVLKSGQADAETLSLAAALAEAQGAAELKELFTNLEFPKREIPTLTKEELGVFAGKYALKEGASQLTITAGEKGLAVDLGFGGPQDWVALKPTEFRRGNQQLTFKLTEGKVTSVELSFEGTQFEYFPASATADAAEKKPEPESKAAAETKPASAGSLSHVASEWDKTVSSVNWPGFRGQGSRGVAEGQRPPLTWNVKSGENVAWRTKIPGFGNSCPVIWGEHLFVTSAVSAEGNKEVRIGIYGDVESVEDDSVYDFVLYCLNKQSGEVVWQRTCKSARPAVKRHSKSSHANPTVATDGERVVAWFGSEGLYAFDLAGNPLWNRDLGLLDSGWFYDPSYQWGFGSSPIIFGDRLILQCDIQKGSFVAALDLKTGEDVWRTEREEIPTWSTPLVHQFGDLPLLVTHGTRAARGYDARDGKLLWWLADHSEIVVPTPNVAHGLIFLASGYAPIQPIIAVRPEARGELKLPGRKPKDGGDAPDSDPGIAWSEQRGGPYMPTPIVYGDFLYICSNSGVLTCYRALTGEQVYKKRLSGGIQSFTGSPVAADGHLYFPAEDGRVLVVKAGGEFEQLHDNEGDGKVLSTPAISEGTFFLRTTDEVIALRELPQPK